MYELEYNRRVVDHGVQIRIQEARALSQRNFFVGNLFVEEVIRRGLAGVHQRVPLAACPLRQIDNNWEVACIERNVKLSLMLVHLHSSWQVDLHHKECKNKPQASKESTKSSIGTIIINSTLYIWFSVSLELMCCVD